MANSSIYNTLFTKIKKGGEVKNILSIISDKKEFLIQVFGTLIFQLLVTFIIAFNITTSILDSNLNFWLLVILSFIIIITLALVPMPPLLKFILFTLFSGCWGILLSKIKLDSN